MRERLEIRVTPALRRQLEALSRSEHRSLNSFTNLRLTEGLDRWLRRKKEADAPRPYTTRGVERELAEIKRELRASVQPPPLPTDLSDKERMMLGLPPDEELPAMPAEPEISPELLELVEQVQRLGFVQGRRADE